LIKANWHLPNKRSSTCSLSNWAEGGCLFEREHHRRIAVVLACRASASSLKSSWKPAWSWTRPAQQLDRCMQGLQLHTVSKAALWARIKALGRASGQGGQPG